MIRGATAISRDSISPANRFRSAQATVEFAVTIAVFLLISFTTMKMALGVYNYNMVCSAAREAVRYAIAHSPNSPNPASTAQIQQFAIDSAPGLSLTPSNVTVTWTADPSLPSRQDAQVKVSYPYRLTIPFMSPQTVTLTSTSQMLASQ